MLASAYQRSLEVAAGHGARSVAFPSISTGVYRYPKHLAAEIALDAVSASLAQLDLDEVRFVVFGNDDLAIYLQVMQVRASAWARAASDQLAQTIHRQSTRGYLVE